MAGFIESLFDPSVLYNMLKEQNLLPQWAQTSPVTSASGSYYPDTNQLVAPTPDNPVRRNTVAHEMSHAVQDNMFNSMASHISEKKWQRQPTTPQEEQFLDTATKLMNKQYGRIGQYDARGADANKASLSSLLDGLYKSPVTANEKDPEDLLHKLRYDAYRTSPTEAQAFGIGSFTEGAEPHQDKVGNHFDPSMATDFNVLMEMYKQLPQGLKDLASADRQRQITVSRNAPIPNSSVRNYYSFQPRDAMFDNPFIMKEHTGTIRPLVKKRK